MNIEASQGRDRVRLFREPFCVENFDSELIHVFKKGFFIATADLSTEARLIDWRLLFSSLYLSEIS
jgi:hypothetical protein